MMKIVHLKGLLFFNHAAPIILVINSIITELQMALNSLLIKQRIVLLLMLLMITITLTPLAVKLFLKSINEKHPKYEHLLFPAQLIFAAAQLIYTNY